LLVQNVMLDTVAEIAAVVSPFELADIGVERLRLMWIILDKSQKLSVVRAIKNPFVIRVIC
jgi:hypothetical protein